MTLDPQKYQRTGLNLAAVSSHFLRLSQTRILHHPTFPVVKSLNMLAKKFLSGRRSGSCPVSDMNAVNFLQYLRRRVTKTQLMSTECSVVSILTAVTLQNTLCPLLRKCRSTALIQQSVQMTDSEKTCTVAVRMLSIGSASETCHSNSSCSRPPPGNCALSCRITDSSLCSSSRRLPIKMFRISCVFVNGLFVRSRAKAHRVAVSIGKFVESTFPNDFWKCSSTLHKTEEHVGHLDFFWVRCCSSFRYHWPVDSTTSEMCGQSCTSDGSETAVFW